VAILKIDNGKLIIEKFGQDTEVPGCFITKNAY
jgi:hypothetical protein